MAEERPDPDALLARIQAEEEKKKRGPRGKLKIFFGMAPGAGKTYAMLEAGRQLSKEGRDVVVGYVEPHARPETLALVLGLDVLPRREVHYQGLKLFEFHLEAALKRKPEVILVDELAHTNAPGSIHAKRWQDVQELLEAGIDVFSTLNVQHLESLNDVVAQITGISVRETVPDSVFDQASEIEIVDISPEELLDRLREGKIYLPEQARRALENFFRKGNLIALRELTLRRGAERIGAQVDDYRRRHAIAETWPAHEHLLVCVSPSPMSARLIRAARRMAAGLQAKWTALHVETPGKAALPPEDRDRLARNLHLAEQLGARIATASGQDMVAEVLAYARAENVTKIIVGKTLQPRWREWLRGSFVYEITRRSGEIDVYVISGDRHSESAPAARPPPRAPAREGYFWAAATVAFSTTVSFLLTWLFPATDPTNLVMVYLLGVVAVSFRWGPGASVLTSVLSVVAFDFCFVPPRFTFAVDDTQYLLTFGVMLLTGLVISTLAARTLLQAEAARQRESRTATLLAMSRDLSALQDLETIVRSAVTHIGGTLRSSVAILLPGDDGRLAAAAGLGGWTLPDRDWSVAQWAFEHRQRAGKGTGTLPGAEGLYIPLVVSRGTAGILAIRTGPEEPALEPERFYMIEALAGVTALAIERAQLAEEAERNRLRAETERLRNSLLSAVSHDLRTPLAAIAGASSTLVDSGRSLDEAARRELAASIYDESQRLSRLVTNLLEMTRLESGAFVLRKDWHPIDDVLGAAVHRLRQLLEKHQVEVDVPPEPLLVPLDEVLIQEVLLNLIENAAKFTPPGSRIRIAARVLGDRVAVEVADQGPGIPAGQEERVFEKFFRDPVGTGRAGAGLGLAIAKGIVDLHGGSIAAENRPEGGAVFRFTLPIDAPPPEVEPAEQPAALPAETRK
jgi:two-component system sensor histidine kinase KdpD